MSTGLRSVVDSGTKLWLDSIDPDLVQTNLAHGATGATSNPIIISDLIKTSRFDDLIAKFADEDHDDAVIAWALTDHLVQQAQKAFDPAWRRSGGDDGYVSFELDPLLEDPNANLPLDQRVAAYVELGKRWARGHHNRMIKVPATDAGIAALEPLAAAGVTLNVTLVFTPQQFRQARDAVWRGAQKLNDRSKFKSVYSIFVSRVDVYTVKHAPKLSPAAQGQVGIVNAKRIWKENRDFWADKHLPLHQEMIFASTGAKLKGDAPDKYVAALAGSDIMTNPPETNDQVQKLGRTYPKRVDQLPGADVLAEIDRTIDLDHLHKTLMSEGIAKFADPQKALLALIAQKRQALTPRR
ncbi:MAG: transaldolase [Phycisphaeraceae bacterium]|nr:transaldolase [Phycisphaeraceae bacterium]